MPNLPIAFKSRMKKRLLYVPVWLWIAFALISAIFVLIPEIDLAVSRFFYTPGVGFEANGTTLERFTHKSVGFLLVWGNIGLVAWLLFGRFARWSRVRFTAKELGVLLLFLVLGPGLVVNVLLKENWGRARPVDLAQFGGSSEFTAAFIPSDQEGRSFSSGHAAASTYWILAVLLIAPRQVWLLGTAVAYSLFVSWMRIAAGGHFLSDIVASYFIVAILGIALYEIAYKQQESVR